MFNQTAFEDAPMIILSTFSKKPIGLRRYLVRFFARPICHSRRGQHRSLFDIRHLIKTKGRRIMNNLSPCLFFTVGFWRQL